MSEPTKPGARSTPSPHAADPRRHRPAAVTPLPVDHNDLERLVGGAHHDPHSILGPHPGATGGTGVTIRSLRPWATAWP